MNASRITVIAALVVVGTLPNAQSAPSVARIVTPTVLQGFAGEAARVSCGDAVLQHGLHRPGGAATSPLSFD